MSTPIGLNESLHRRSRGSRSGWRIAGAIVLVVCLAAAATVTWYVTLANKRLDQAIQSIRAAGEPASAAEMDAWRARNKPGVDNSHAWLGAIAKGKVGSDALPNVVQGLIERPAWTDTSYMPPLPGSPWLELAEVSAYLDERRLMLDALHRAAETPGVTRYPLSFEQGIEMPLGHVDGMRMATQALFLEAHVRARQGDGPGAAGSIRTIFALASSNSESPLLVLQVFRASLDARGREAALSLVPHLNLEDGVLKGLQDTAREALYRPDLKAAMIGERIVGLQTIRNPTLIGLTRREAFFYRLVSRQDEAKYLELMDQAVQAARRTDIPFDLGFVDVKSQWALILANPFTRAKYPITNLLLPGCENAFTILAKAEAKNMALEVAIAVSRYRLATGGLPTRLADVVPRYLDRIPADPYLGEGELQYQNENGWVAIYSVGRNVTDDAGEIDDDERGESLDVGVRIDFSESAGSP